MIIISKNFIVKINFYNNFIKIYTRLSRINQIYHILSSWKHVGCLVFWCYGFCLPPGQYPRYTKTNKQTKTDQPVHRIEISQIPIGWTHVFVCVFWFSCFCYACSVNVHVCMYVYACMYVCMSVYVYLYTYSNFCLYWGRL